MSGAWRMHSMASPYVPITDYADSDFLHQNADLHLPLFPCFSCFSCSSCTSKPPGKPHGTRGSITGAIRPLVPQASWPSWGSEGSSQNPSCCRHVLHFAYSIFEPLRWYNSHRLGDQPEAHSGRWIEWEYCDWPGLQSGKLLKTDPSAGKDLRGTQSEDANGPIRPVFRTALRP